MRPSDLVRLLGAAAVTAVVCFPHFPQKPSRTSTQRFVASSPKRLRHDSARSSTRTTAPSSDRATPAEAATLACIRRAESHDSFWRWGFYPHGWWGDGGGAFQIEPQTWATGAALAHLDPADHSAGHQYRVALALLRAFGAHSSETWGGDAC